MPTYVYEVILEDGEPGMRFEVTQSIKDEPLTHHPTTGQPVRRVPQAPHIGGQWSDASEKRKLSDDNLGKMGFTKYVKTDTGKYEKTTGDGPSNISADGNPQ